MLINSLAFFTPSASVSTLAVPPSNVEPCAEIKKGEDEVGVVGVPWSSSPESMIPNALASPNTEWFGDEEAVDGEALATSFC